MKKYDMLVFQETKSDKLDHVNLPNGYSYKAKHRQKCTWKSGGILIIFKSQIDKVLFSGWE